MSGVLRWGFRQCCGTEFGLKGFVVNIEKILLWHDFLAHAERVLRLRCLADTHCEFPRLAGNVTAQSQYIAQVRVTTLIKRARQPDAQLYRDDLATPGKLRVR